MIKGPLTTKHAGVKIIYARAHAQGHGRVGLVVMSVK